MNCVDVNDRLPELAAGALPGEVRRGVEAHLRGCEACADAWTTVRALSATRPAVPADLEARVRRAVQAAVTAPPEGILSLEAHRGQTRGKEARRGDTRSWARPPAWMLGAAALFVLAVGTPLMVDRAPRATDTFTEEELAMAERTLTPSVWASDDGLIAGSPALDGLSDAALLALLEELEAGA